MPQGFSSFVEQFKAGHLDNELSREMSELVEAVQKYGRKGEITIKLVITPKDDGEADVNVKFAAKPPRRDTLSAPMFITPEHRLIATNPNQPSFFDGPVASPRAKLETVKSL